MPIRLTDLDPSWMAVGEGRRGMGVIFDCPVHRGHCSIGVWFANPIDGGPPAPSHEQPTYRWKRSGESFENLTLHPSVDASGYSRNGTPCWHGWLKNGEIS